jgi:hypothetical protein
MPSRATRQNRGGQGAGGGASREPSGQCSSACSLLGGFRSWFAASRGANLCCCLSCPPKHDSYAPRALGFGSGTFPCQKKTRTTSVLRRPAPQLGDNTGSISVGRAPADRTFGRARLLPSRNANRRRQNQEAQRTSASSVEPELRPPGRNAKAPPAERRGLAIRLRLAKCQ